MSERQPTKPVGQPSSKPAKHPTDVRIRSVKFNVLMNMIVTTSSVIFPLITVPYVSRVLSTGGTGHVAFAQSVASYFSLVALLGVTYYGVRVCARVRDDRAELSRTVLELLVILACSTTMVFAVYLACLFTVPKMNAQFGLFALFGLAIWLSSFGVEWFYQALEQYEYITVRSVCFKLLALVLMFAFVRQRGDYAIYGLIVVVAGYGSNVLNLLRLRRLVDFRNCGHLNISRHFKPMLWFTIASISSGMYIQVDIVMLGFLGTTDMVGLYQLVSKIKSVLVTAVNSVGNVMLPRLSYYQARRKERQAGELIAKNMNFVMVFGSAIIALLILLADPIVALLGGADFAESAVPLRFVGIAVMCSAMNIVLANIMISKGMERGERDRTCLGRTRKRAADSTARRGRFRHQHFIVRSVDAGDALICVPRVFGWHSHVDRSDTYSAQCDCGRLPYAGRDRDMRCRDMERLPVADVRRIPVHADIWHRVAAVPRTIRYGHASAGIQPTACTENE